MISGLEAGTLGAGAVLPKEPRWRCQHFAETNVLQLKSLQRYIIRYIEYILILYYLTYYDV